MSMNYFLGQVIRRSTTKLNIVKVRSTRNKLDKRLLMYFPKAKDYWVQESEEPARIGDVVLLSECKKPNYPDINFQIHETVFRVGSVVDPVTGRRCRGTEYIDEKERQASREIASKIDILTTKTKDMSLNKDKDNE